MPTRDDIRKRVAMDLAVKKMLEQEGDEPLVMHTIDHQMLADELEVLVTFARATQAFGWTAGEVGRVEEGGRVVYSLSVKSRGLTVTSRLVRESVLMVALAEAYGCMYNGWGTGVVKKGEGGEKE